MKECLTERFALGEERLKGICCVRGCEIPVSFPIWQAEEFIRDHEGNFVLLCSECQNMVKILSRCQETDNAVDLRFLAELRRYVLAAYVTTGYLTFDWSRVNDDERDVHFSNFCALMHWEEDIIQSCAEIVKGKLDQLPKRYEHVGEYWDPQWKPTKFDYSTRKYYQGIGEDIISGDRQIVCDLKNLPIGVYTAGDEIGPSSH